MTDGRCASLRALAWTYALAAILMTAAGLWLMHLAYEAAAEVVRLDGKNIDSGAILSVIALFYFFPNAVLWALAALSMWKRWDPRERWVVLGIAAFFTIVPVLWASVPR
jgi:hypothetical protein